MAQGFLLILFFGGVFAQNGRYPQFNAAGRKFSIILFELYWFKQNVSAKVNLTEKMFHLADSFHLPVVNRDHDGLKILYSNTERIPLYVSYVLHRNNIGNESRAGHVYDEIVGVGVRSQHDNDYDEQPVRVIHRGHMVPCEDRSVISQIITYLSFLISQA